MYITGIVFVLSCLVLGVPARGGTFMCRTCHNVKDPSSCTTFERCHEHESCVTQVHSMNNEYVFTKSCKESHHTCDHNQDLLLGKRQGPHHEHGQLVCQKCCHTSGCGSDLCSTYFTAANTHAPATTISVVDSACRDYESATFQCAELEKYNFCTDTSSVGYAIAHDKCAKHCGFCSPYWTVSHVTMAPTTTTTHLPPVTMKPTTTMSSDFSTTMVGGISPVVVNVNITATISSGDCADNDDPTLTCADMQRFGFCSSDSGAGYTFAKERCRKTCQFC
ncbi:uncharacterized protein LOC123548369 [Mercenaria mercenaria]|uniref:uncharacterized protein LOC123548369 n=1 Tax=Mercenaria mercenaria TaxID=6596 RepID=UPI00234F8184|nr:uncharacterized protein LOC123548369 [Mercenaria mercenaria]